METEHLFRVLVMLYAKCVYRRRRRRCRLRCPCRPPASPTVLLQQLAAALHYYVSFRFKACNFQIKSSIIIIISTLDEIARHSRVATLRLRCGTAVHSE